MLALNGHLEILHKHVLHECVACYFVTPGHCVMCLVLFISIPSPIIDYVIVLHHLDTDTLTDKAHMLSIVVYVCMYICIVLLNVHTYVCFNLLCSFPGF